jgi:hypothetical protein
MGQQLPALTLDQTGWYANSGRNNDLSLLLLAVGRNTGWRCPRPLVAHRQTSLQRSFRLAIP